LRTRGGRGKNNDWEGGGGRRSVIPPGGENGEGDLEAKAASALKGGERCALSGKGKEATLFSAERIRALKIGPAEGRVQGVDLFLKRFVKDLEKERGRDRKKKEDEGKS